MNKLASILLRPFYEEIAQKERWALAERMTRAYFTRRFPDALVLIRRRPAVMSGVLQVSIGYPHNLEYSCHLDDIFDYRLHLTTSEKYGLRLIDRAKESP